MNDCHTLSYTYHRAVNRYKLRIEKRRAAIHICRNKALSFQDKGSSRRSRNCEIQKGRRLLPINDDKRPPKALSSMGPWIAYHSVRLYL